MKRFSVLILSFLILFPFAASAARSYVPKNAKLYEVGNIILPGSYSLELDEKGLLNVAVVTVGNDLQYTPGRDAILIKNGEYTEYKIDRENPSLILDLVEGNKLFVNAGSPRLVSLDGKNGTSKPSVKSTPTPSYQKLSAEEVKKMTSRAPYVSSKNITIDSQEGVDFYTYLGGGIIMSGTSGDCFKMVDCDDEPIVDHYKLIPVKPGKGKIEYVINMQKKIVVNVTVKDSAFASAAPADPSGATSVKAIKSVNIRADASTSSKKVGSIKKGENLTLIKANFKEGWHQVEYKGKNCYVSAQYVELK